VGSIVEGSPELLCETMVATVVPNPPRSLLVEPAAFGRLRADTWRTGARDAGPGTVTERNWCVFWRQCGLIWMPVPRAAEFMFFALWLPATTRHFLSSRSDILKQ
jgi:hypothetical protein